MAMTTELKNTFDNLERDASSLLDPEEKNLLKKVDRTACRNAVEDIKNEEFTIGNSPMTLENIVNSIDPNSSTTTVNDVEIGRNTDLAAAIQIYLMTKGETLAIDGIIGKDTKQAIKNVQLHDQVSDLRNQVDMMQNDSLVDTLAQLQGQYYQDRVGIYNDPKYELLNSDGALKEQITIQGDKLVISYVSVINNSQKKRVDINIKADACKSGGRFSRNKLGEQIKNAIKAKEKARWDSFRLNNLKNGVANFDEKTVSSSLLKDYFTKGDTNFQFLGYNGSNGNLSIRMIHNRVVEKNFDVKNGFSLLDGNGRFDKNKFEKELALTVGDKAIKSAMLEATNKASYFDREQAYGEIIRGIKNINYEGKFNKQLGLAEGRKEVNRVGKIIDSRDASRVDKIKALRDLVEVKENNDAARTITIKFDGNKKDLRQKFINAGEGAKYMEAVRKNAKKLFPEFTGVIEEGA